LTKIGIKTSIKKKNSSIALRQSSKETSSDSITQKHTRQFGWRTWRSAFWCSRRHVTFLYLDPVIVYCRSRSRDLSRDDFPVTGGPAEQGRRRQTDPFNFQPFGRSTVCVCRVNRANRVVWTRASWSEGRRRTQQWRTARTRDLVAPVQSSPGNTAFEHGGAAVQTAHKDRRDQPPFRLPTSGLFISFVSVFFFSDTAPPFSHDAVTKTHSGTRIRRQSIVRNRRRRLSEPPSASPLLTIGFVPVRYFETCSRFVIVCTYVDWIVHSTFNVRIHRSGKTEKKNRT